MQKPLTIAIGLHRNLRIVNQLYLRTIISFLFSNTTRLSSYYNILLYCVDILKQKRPRTFFTPKVVFVLAVSLLFVNDNIGYFVEAYKQMLRVEA